MSLPTTMKAVKLVGHGGIDQLVWDDAFPLRSPGSDEVVVKVGAAGVNNTDINTRIGWYSKKVDGDTESGGAAGFGDTDLNDDASWSGVPLQFPRIQGADVAGTIVAVGTNVDPARVGQRVLIASIQTANSRGSNNPVACWTFGSECDGGFAQYAIAHQDETYAVSCDWSDAELASIPCAYSTAENMLHRADLQAGERILITGASGGVGSAAIQLAKRRGAYVIAQASSSKATQVLDAGADEVVDREQNLSQHLRANSVDMVADLVAGPSWPQLLDVLRPGGRYSTAGAIAGPMVELDVRTLYLKDLTFFGSTYQPPEVFQNLVGYIERGDIKPLVSQTYPLDQIHQAQEDFLAKKFVGKLVLIPPQD